MMLKMSFPDLVIVTRCGDIR